MLALLFAVGHTVWTATAQSASGQASYLGFDLNDYPGDANLKALRQTFSYTGYWLNNPPGATSNTWGGTSGCRRIRRIRISRAVQRASLRGLKTGPRNATRQSDARLPSRRSARRLSAQPSSFSIRSRAAACCRAEGLHLRLGRRHYHGGIPRGHLLLRHARYRRQQCRDRGRHSSEAGSRQITYWADRRPALPRPDARLLTVVRPALRRVVSLR